MANKKLYVLVFTIAVFAVFMPSAALAENGSKALRVMSFNIRYNEPRDGKNAWLNRKDKVAGVIRFHKADLVGLQEALIGQLKDLEAALPDFAYCGVGRDDGGEKGEFSAILYRKSRFKLLETKTTWISETPLVPGSKGWGANYARIVTWAKFYDKASKKTFVHFNTHFDHEAEKARQEGAKIIVKLTQELGGKVPFVITGDLNTVEDSEGYRIFTAQGNRIKDTAHTSRNPSFGPTTTWNGFGAMVPNRKIDYVLVRDDIIVNEHGVLADQWDGLWASDHLPVLAEVELPKR